MSNAMAHQVHDRDISKTLHAASSWINTCLVSDHSVFSQSSLWRADLIEEVYHAFVDHPDLGEDDFLTKLRGQIGPASNEARQLASEMLWALLLFPSNVKPATKRRQVREIWAMSGAPLPEDHPLLCDAVLAGIGSGGPGFNTYRPDELEYLVEIARSLKSHAEAERRNILSDYDKFGGWIATVPREGYRQFRHMLRYFAFPDRVERMSSNNDRRAILDAFDVAPDRDTRKWTDQQLDDALLKLRSELSASAAGGVFDFYAEPFRSRWAPERKGKVKTPEGEVTVVIPADDEPELEQPTGQAPAVRLSIQIQAKLVEIGAFMGFKVWVPRADRGRVQDTVQPKCHTAFVDELPLSYDETTIGTIALIDVLWLKGRSIARAFGQTSGDLDVRRVSNAMPAKPRRD